MENIYKIFFIIFITVLVIAMAYYATVLIGKKSSVYFQGRCVRVLERTVISPNFSIIAVQTIDKVYIIALQNKNMILLDTVESMRWQEYKSSQKAEINNKGMINELMTLSSKITSNKKGDEDSDHDNT
ncbi:MAG: hypothetical protein JJT76_05170 [Clostridiaceae bacterium]|nr:hypothetical protein [Clostridiaceae bacterium]